MNNNWSQFVQTSEELYRSRALRFTDENKDLWLNAIGVTDGIDVLELGCAGGLFCHRIKKHLPKTKVTGLDFDSGHIEYAKQKSAELGLDCEFVNGDATKLPFGDNTFDLCYSHTVVEHVPTTPFLFEQLRVLKPDGRIAVLSVRTRLSVRNNNWYIVGEGEEVLSGKLWAKANKNQPVKDIGSYEMDEKEYPVVLERAGFRDVNVDFITVTEYAPDNASVTREAALEQINCNRLSSLASMEKALRLDPDALPVSEQTKLRTMINKRYDKRVELYLSGEKQWDFSTVTVLIASGRK
ncbi:MAG: class I SAM-dependent methyltransferase [Christensenellales bacterium]|jgi:ubiquinone/menaquinone biosynthesis C-methylase UbiE